MVSPAPVSNKSIQQTIFQKNRKLHPSKKQRQLQAVKKLSKKHANIPIDVYNALVTVDIFDAKKSLAIEEKVLQAKILHAQWEKEDANHIMEGDELIFCQKQRCKELGMVVFEFTLNDEQVDAIWTLCYKHEDLLLLAKTGFGKSVIFQLPPFMSSPSGVVIILSLSNFSKPSKML